MTAKQRQEEEEAREIMEVSMLDDDDDELLSPSEIKSEHEKNVEKITEMKSATNDNVKTPISTPKIKSITSKTGQMDSTIFDELRDIDFDAEALDDVIGNVDFSTVSIF